MSTPTLIRVGQTSELEENARISSAPIYDENLVKAFPFFAYVAFEDAPTLAVAISEGLFTLTLAGHGSFALTMDFRSNGYVLWLSSSSYETLRQKLDEDQYVLTSVSRDQMWYRPTHEFVSGGVE